MSKTTAFVPPLSGIASSVHPPGADSLRKEGSYEAGGAGKAAGGSIVGDIFSRRTACAIKRGGVSAGLWAAHRRPR